MPVYVNLDMFLYRNKLLFLSSHELSPVCLFLLALPPVPPPRPRYGAPGAAQVHPAGGGPDAGVGPERPAPRVPGIGRGGGRANRGQTGASSALPGTGLARPWRGASGAG